MRGIALYVATLLLGAFLVLAWADRREAHYNADAAAWKARESMLQDSLAKAILDVRVDSVEVVRTVRQVSERRDTLLLNLTDTVRVKEFIYSVDTLREACLRCTESAARLRVVSDSVVTFWIKRYEAVKPSRWDKVKPFVFGAVGLYVGLNAPR